MNKHMITRRHFGKRTFLATSGLLAMPAILHAGTVSIIDRTSTKRISISNGSFARPFDVGTWSTLRLGFTMQMEFTGALTSLTPRFVVGLCSGTSDQVFDATTTNFIGFRTVVATWSYTAGAVDDLSFAGGNLKAAKRVGSTWTDGSGFTGSGIYFNRASEASDNQWATIILEVAKGTPNYALKAMLPTTSPNAGTHALLMAQIAEATPSITTHTWSSAVNLAFDEVAGALNAIQIGWDRTEATVEIGEIAVVKMA